jgi:hypothetical protein
MVREIYVGRSGKLLLVLASILILGYRSRGTHDHIFVSQLWEWADYSKYVCENPLGFIHTRAKLLFENVPFEAEYRKWQGWVQIHVCVL